MDVGTGTPNVLFAPRNSSGASAPKPGHSIRVALRLRGRRRAPVSCSARRSGVSDQRAPIAVELLRDPTIYAPSALLYASMRLDWNSSQPFFQNGFVEENARYTRSGFARDTPLSYSDGNRQILKDALMILPLSIVNSAVTHMVERRLSERFPGNESSGRRCHGSSASPLRLRVLSGLGAALPAVAAEPTSCTTYGFVPR